MSPTVLALPATALPDLSVGGLWLALLQFCSTQALGGIKLHPISSVLPSWVPPFSSPAHPTFPGEQERADCPQCPWPQWSPEATHLGKVFMLSQLQLPSVSPRPACHLPAREASPAPIWKLSCPASDRLLMSPSMVPCTWFVD